MLKSFATAITENPQGSIKDHIDAIGISEASFYCTFGSKVGFEHKLKMKIWDTLSDIICICGSSFDRYYEGLKLVIEAHITHKEIICLLCLNPFYLSFNNGGAYEQEFNYWIPYKKALESFFVKGKKKGDFKFELTQTELTNHLLFTIAGVITMNKNEDILMDNIVAKVEQLFLYGVEGRVQEDGAVD